MIRPVRAVLVSSSTGVGRAVVRGNRSGDVVCAEVKVQATETDVDRVSGAPRVAVASSR